MVGRRSFVRPCGSDGDELANGYRLRRGSSRAARLATSLAGSYDGVAQDADPLDLDFDHVTRLHAAGCARGSGEDQVDGINP